MRSHGIMFHHFYNDIHPKGQGAINADELDVLLKFYKKSYNVIRTDEWIHKFYKNSLTKYDVCITFDDTLKCQYDVALPVLEKYDLNGFWFIYTSPLLGKGGEGEHLEFYRHFRTICFENIDDFYQEFFQEASNYFPKVKEALNHFDPNQYLTSFPFYTKNDKRFRYVRDHILKEKNYDEIMNKMLINYKYNKNKYRQTLWMDKTDIQSLHNKGHIIGLHSHSHSTILNTFPKDDQKNEWLTNKKILEEIIQEKIFSASYPCNSYNDDTLDIMKELKIDFAFRSNMDKYFTSPLEFPRQDHSIIIKQIKKEH